MDAPEGPAAPVSGTDETLDLAALAADPEIAPLLDFEPVPMRKRVNGWDADAQRAFVVLLATTGSKLHAAKAIGREPASMDRVLRKPEADGLNAAVDAALALAERRNGQEIAQGLADAAAYRSRKSSSFRFAGAGAEAEAAPGEVLNEFDEWEDKESLHRRAEDARDSISNKLLAARRLYLKEISSSPGLRAAFELLTELPVDWDAAARLEPQPDEPWRKPSMRAPDMLLTAENGWLGDYTHGRDKKAELRAAIDAQRAAEGLEPVEWGDEQSSP
ncbi:MAG TPA: hypothetical protein VF027_04945 [Sphingomicrobium sp.]